MTCSGEQELLVEESAGPVKLLEGEEALTELFGIILGQFYAASIGLLKTTVEQDAEEVLPSCLRDDGEHPLVDCEFLLVWADEDGDDAPAKDIAGSR